MARDNILKVRILADDETKKAFRDATATVGAFGAAASAALALATREAAKFETGMAEINTLLGRDGRQAVQGMRRELLELSRQSGETLGDLTRARYDVISAGFGDSAESAKVLGASLDLAKGGLVDVASAADLLTTALNGMGLSADESDRVANILFSTVRLGKTTMTELGESMGQIFATAKVANVSLEEVAAAMASITAAGIQTREAGTAITQLLQALAAPASESAKQLDALGISLDEGLGSALQSLATVGEDGLDALKALIPNIRALKAAAAAGSDIEGFNENLAEVEENTDGLSEAVEIMNATVTEELKKLRQEFKVFAIQIGDALFPLLRGIVGAISNVAKAFNSLPPAAKQFIAISAALAAALSTIAAGLGGIVLAANAAIPALLTTGAALAPLLPVVAAVTVAGIGLGVAISKVSDEFDRVGASALDAKRILDDTKPSLILRDGQKAAADTADAAGEATEQVDHLAQAFDLVSEKTSTARFQLMEMLGETPSELQLLRDALVEVGAPLELIERTTKRLGEGMTDLLPDIDPEQLTAGIDDAISGGIGEMPELDLPREPMTEFEFFMKESFREIQIAGQNAFDDTFGVFGDSLAAAIVDGEKFSSVFADGFKQVKRAIISATVSLLAYRAVMKGLQKLSTVSGPIGAIAGFFLNTGTSYVPTTKANTGFGVVPGTPGLDATPALLSGGESVLTRRSTDLLRRALRMPSQGGSSILDSVRSSGDRRPVVVGLEAGLLRTEAAQIDDRYERIQKRRGGRA